jgi:hypothetical protein
LDIHTFRNQKLEEKRRLHPILAIAKIAKSCQLVGSGAQWLESRWIKDMCTGFSPWEVHRKKDLGHQI